MRYSTLFLVTLSLLSYSASALPAEETALPAERPPDGDGTFDMTGIAEVLRGITPPSGSTPQASSKPRGRARDRKRLGMKLDETAVRESIRKPRRNAADKRKERKEKKKKDEALANDLAAAFGDMSVDN